jgi:hypothetical protein
VGPFPDGRIRGRLEPAPADAWPFAAERVLALEADPADPYSVNLHFVCEGPRLWVATVLGESSSWARRVLVDPRVRVSGDDRIYERTAVRVTDRAEIEHVAKLYIDKYVISPDVSEWENALVFRLEAR